MAALIPTVAILLVERDEVADGIDAGGATRVREQQECQQSRNLRVVGQQLVQHPRDLQRSIGEIGAHQRLSRDSDVAGVVDQLHGVEDGFEPLGQFGRSRRPVGDRRLGDLLLGPRDPRLHRGFLDQERLGDLGRGEPADHAQGQGDAGVARQRRVAADEDQPQAVVGQVLEGRSRARVVRRVVIDGQRRQLARCGRRLALGLQHLAHGDCRQPGAGTVGDSVASPPHQGLREGVLNAVLGDIEVACDPHHRGKHLRPLGPVRRSHRVGDLARSHDADRAGRISTATDSWTSCFATRRASSRSRRSATHTRPNTSPSSANRPSLTTRPRGVLRTVVAAWSSLSSVP